MLDGLISEGVWAQCLHPKGKVVLGTKRLYSCKNGKRGEVVKYNCRLVSQGFRQIKELPYEESPFPTTAAASIRMALVTAAVMDMELLHIDFEEAYLLADGDTKIYIGLPEECREFPDAVGKLNEAIYGLLQAGRYWDMRLANDLKTLRFEQSLADLCVFRNFVSGKMEAIIVVHVDGLLALTVTKEAMETFAGEL